MFAINDKSTGIFYGTFLAAMTVKVNILCGREKTVFAKIVLQRGSKNQSYRFFKSKNPPFGRVL